MSNSKEIKETELRGIDKYSNIKACGITVRDIASEFNFKNVNSFRHSSKFGVYMRGVDRLLGVGIEIGRGLEKRSIVEQLNKKI